MDTQWLHIQPGSPEPMYLQIMGQVRRLVAAGQLVPGDEMPSVRLVAAAHEINPMTVSKAYSKLHDEGLLVRLPGKGMAVAPKATSADEESRWGLIDPALQDVVRLARELDLPKGALLDRLQKMLEDKPED